MGNDLGSGDEGPIASAWDRLAHIEASQRGLSLRWNTVITRSTAAAGQIGREDRRLGVWMIILGLPGFILWIALQAYFSGSGTLYICRAGLFMVVIVMVVVGPIAFAYGGATARMGRTKAGMPLDGNSDGQWAGVEIAINRLLTVMGLRMEELMLDRDGHLVYSMQEARSVVFELPEDLSITLDRGIRGPQNRMTVEISGINVHNMSKAKKVQLIIDGLPFYDDRTDRR